MTRASAAKPTARRAPRPRPAAPRVVLSSRDWTVLALLLVERLSLSEAACALETTPDALRRRYDRALARLRRAVGPWTSRAAGDAPAANRTAS